jgi:hypothetical protein
VRVTQRLGDSFEYPISVPQHIVVPKAQHTITLFFQEPTPFMIRRGILRVLATVQFHH